MLGRWRVGFVVWGLAFLLVGLLFLPAPSWAGGAPETQTQTQTPSQEGHREADRAFNPAERVAPLVTLGPWRIIAADGDPVSSNCIGDWGSPDCILDSALACMAWSRWVPDPDPWWLALLMEHPLCKAFGYRPLPTGLPEQAVVYYRGLWLPINSNLMTSRPSKLLGGSATDSWKRLNAYHFSRPLRPGDLLLAVQWWRCDDYPDGPLPAWLSPLPAWVAPSIARPEGARACSASYSDLLLLLGEEAGGWVKLGYYEPPGYWVEGDFFWRALVAGRWR